MVKARQWPKKDFTDDLATALNNDKLSGLLSASMGNLVEIILSVAFIRGQQFRVLQYSLVGSVLSNAALVFGTSILCACIARYREKRCPTFVFSVGDATMHGVQLLVMASVVWLYSTAQDADGKSPGSTITCERVTAALLLLLYIVNVVVQLLGGEDDEVPEGGAPKDEAEDTQPDYSAALRSGGALLVTAVVTGLVSEHLTSSLESALAGSILSRGFVSAILLPVAGNACEHATAVRFAMQERAALAIGVSLGSAVQVATFAYPLAALLAIPFGPLGFDCGLGVAKLLVLGTILMLATVGDGKGTPQEGLILLGFYVLSSIYFMSV